MNARVRKNDLEAERTLDHLKRIREEFDSIYKRSMEAHGSLIMFEAYDMEALIESSHKWYGNHPEVIQMEKDFNSY